MEFWRTTILADEQVFLEKIQPALAQASATAIAKRIGVSRWYAGRIRKGYRPHARHWLALAKLIGIIADSKNGSGAANSNQRLIGEQKKTALTMLHPETH